MRRAHRVDPRQVRVGVRAARPRVGHRRRHVPAAAHHRPDRSDAVAVLGRDDRRRSARLEIGFVSAVVEPDELPAAAEAEAKRYANASPFAVRRTKQLIYGGMHNSLDQHVIQTAELLKECFHSKDHAEGVAAFLERRPANFTGQ